MSAPALLTEAEAAQALRVCTRTLRKARRDGALTFVLIGRAVRYTQSDLEQFIESSRQANTPCRQVKTRRTLPAKRGVIVPFSAR